MRALDEKKREVGDGSFFFFSSLLLSWLLYSEPSPLLCQSAGKAS